ncbi:ATP phosphoribosyltransferase [Breznakia sp. PF5-3]|nr:ATP phosphoribosyltransferase [Breznakia sp. PM6-1]MDF9836475.1 ATP phosphoribosyltransferase [Breznakia sp. PF5-3]MDF9838680.1 ATP phosphoribosyltransferase [Breznakia sp. PFB2-8]MDF9860695.1 ATP phosphoribosyltransferase [Breznakia sp. PH5-24]
MISIALTKGRLEKESVKIFEACGYGVEPLKNKGRQLVFHDTKKDIDYFLVKSADCVTYVEHGVADVGFVGKDTLMESTNRYYEIMDLGIGKCGFIVASLPDGDPFKKNTHVKIGTKYPTVAKQYFKEKGMDVEIIKIEGSVELAPILGLCDAIVDIMETGTTLKENGLIVLDRICDISARVIVNKASFRLKRKEITALLDDIKKVIGESNVETN